MAAPAAGRTKWIKHYEDFWPTANRSSDAELTNPKKATLNFYPRAVYIGNIFEVSHLGELQDLLETCGGVKSPRVHCEPVCKWYGFVQYMNQEGAEKAMAELDGTLFNGRKLSVSYEVV